MSRLSVAAFTLLAFLASAAQAEIGRVKRATGAVFIERGSQRLTPKAGDALAERDRIVTGRDGRLAITFVDNSRFAVGPNSRIAVSEFRFNPTTRDGSFVTSVDRGALGVVSGQIAKSRRDAMRVRTPTSLLGVRGTRFVVKVQ